MRLSDFDFDLPDGLIATRPARPRSAARLLVAQGDAITEAQVRDLPDFLQSGDLLVVFADALARTWKQITKFTPEGVAPRAAKKVELPSLESTMTADEAAVAAMEGVVRDERGLVFEREEND